jgi:hypothetical protein
LALDAWVQALEARSYDAIVRMLEAPSATASTDGFEYFIRDDDADQFPWLPPGEGWGYDDETGMMRNMTDPEFVSDETQNPVRQINVYLTITHSEPLDDGLVKLTAAMDAQVLWAAGTGAAMNGRLEVVLVPDGDGFYRIRSQRELPSFAARSVEDGSWAQMKALYR